MGVNTNQYIILGIKIPYDDEKEELQEKLEPYEDNGHSSQITHLDSITVVSDGMNAEYILIGQVLDRSKINETLDGPVELEFDPFHAKTLRYLIKEKFGLDQEVKLWFVTHYH